MAFLAHEIKPVGRLTVITASVPVTSILSQKSNIDVIQLGGITRSSSVSVVGPFAEEMLKHFNCSKLYMGVDGIDLECGLTTTNLLEAALNGVMINSAQKVIVLADSSKFGRRGFSRICSLDSVDMISPTAGCSPISSRSFASGASRCAWLRSEPPPSRRRRWWLPHCAGRRVHLSERAVGQLPDRKAEARCRMSATRFFRIAPGPALRRRGAELFLADELLQLLGVVGGDVVDTQVDEVAHVLLLVYGPDVDLEAQLVRLLDPFGMLAQCLNRVVDAGQTELLDFLGREVAVEVVDFRIGQQLLEGQAGVEREGDDVGPLDKAVLAQRLDDFSAARSSRLRSESDFISSTSRVSGFVVTSFR